MQLKKTMKIQLITTMKLMENKTAIDYLKDKWYSDERITEEDFIQAKEIEKQQIIEARQSIPIRMKRLWWNVNDNDGEDYYNETYKSE